jgi:hypothetical protein
MHTEFAMTGMTPAPCLPFAWLTLGVESRYHPVVIQERGIPEMEKVSSTATDSSTFKEDLP